MTTMTISELKERAERLYEEVVAMKKQSQELYKNLDEMQTRHAWFVMRMREFEKEFSIVEEETRKVKKNE